MRKELKDTIEELVVSSVKDFKSDKTLKPDRIVLYTSRKLSSETLVFNYTQNRFYNQQYMIDHKIPVVIMPYYGERYKKEGDYSIDMGAFLLHKSLKDSVFLDF